MKGNGKNFLAPLFTFLVKYIVIILTVIILAGSSARIAVNQFTSGIGQSMSTMIQTNVSNMNNQLMFFAIENISKVQVYLETLPEEERVKMRARWKRKWNSMRPIIGEFIAILVEEFNEQNAKIEESLQENVLDQNPQNEK